MKKTLSTVALMALLAATGCNNHKTDTPSAVNDIQPPAPPTAYQPTASAANLNSTPATVTPVADFSSTPVPAPAMAADTAPIASKSKTALKAPLVKSTHAKSESSSSGRKYTIQKGDNLMKIAKKEYGKSTEYKKILAANPGLNPDKLMVGKTIIIPQ